MGHRQKGKSKKRKRSWHRRGSGPDKAWQRAIQKLERASTIVPEEKRCSS